MNTPSKSLNEYRLLYFSPRPEDGEQVCVAILENADGRWSLEFDEKLSKLQAISRPQDLDFVLNTLETLRSELGKANPDSLIRSVEPQFHISEPRKLLVGWSDEVRGLLRKRFLRRSHAMSAMQEHAYQHEMEKKIGDLVRSLRPDAASYMLVGAKPEQIFRSDTVKGFKNPKPIASAIIGNSRAVLIDGVDTSVGISTEVIQRANRIAFTFWQYGKASQDTPQNLNLPRHLFKVGVVFDGNPKSAMLRDYSLHQFTKDADLAVEANAGRDLSQVRDEIEKTIADVKI